MSLPDDPVDLVVEVSKTSAWLRLNPATHPLTAVYGAAYVFLDRCYVFLDRDGDAIRVTLAWKNGEPQPGTLETLGEELVSELISCTWRASIVAQTRDLVESASSRANAGSAGPPSLDDLQRYEFGDGAGAFDDPLGIATSWEEKYAKKKAAADPSVPAEEKKEGP
jgi:His-Xaa-Ser system protein HxsD